MTSLQFVPILDTYATDTEANFTWSVLSPLVENRDGIAFYRHPHLDVAGRHEAPDFVVLARGLEPVVVRCFRHPLEAVTEVNDDDWIVGGNVIDSPVLELEDLAVNLRHRFDSQRALRGKLTPSIVLAIPHATEAEWLERFGEPPTEHVLWKDSRLINLPLDGALDDDEWRLATSVFQTADVLKRGAQLKARRSSATTIGEAIRRLDRQIALLDIDQLRAALQIAPGPQRIRGLAGTGKTVLLAMRAAAVHAQYPDANILFTFHTQSLYNQAGKLISLVYRANSGGAEPDWDKVHVRHAWGGTRRPGVYYETCRRQGVVPLRFDEARRLNAREPFRACCEQVLNGEVDAFYDYVLVDEAQDLPATFFRLLWRLTTGQHRICFAYDELQSLTTVELPRVEELFGTNEKGEHVADLDGEYPAGIEKDFVLRRSYRCPLDVLILAHGIGLGIHGPRGVVQMLANEASWRSIGYEIEHGELKAGEQVVIRRPAENSPNPLSQLYGGAIPHVHSEVFNDRQTELGWIAADIESMVKTEQVPPEQILAIAFQAKRAKQDTTQLQRLLYQAGIESTIPGLVDDSAEFAETNKVTLATVYRAKGNEVAIVYIFGFDALHSFADEIPLRNAAFTSISRAKGWVRITGVGEKMHAANAEIAKILGDSPCFRFEFPDINRIRSLDASETTRRRKEVSQAKQALRNLRSLDPDALTDVDPDLLEQVARKLRGQNGDAE